MRLTLAVAGVAVLPLAAIAAPGMPHTASFKVDDSTYIDKYVDASEGVVCYVLRPEGLHYSEDYKGNRGYDGNNVGSMSCLKTSK